jgi:hypothetical protein
VKLFYRTQNQIRIWGQKEGSEIEHLPVEAETLKSINQAKRRSRELQKQGMRFERPAP